MDIQKMKADPRHKMIEFIVGEAVKDFLLVFHDTHEVFEADPKEFVNGAAILNKRTGKKTLYKLTLTAEENVTEERLNQFTEEMINLEGELTKKWSEEKN